MKKIMDFAAQYQIKSGIHGPTDTPGDEGELPPGYEPAF